MGYPVKVTNASLGCDEDEEDKRSENSSRYLTIKLSLKAHHLGSWSNLLIMIAC